MSNIENEVREIQWDVKDIKRILQLLALAMYGGRDLKSCWPAALDDKEKIELTQLVNK